MLTPSYDDSSFSTFKKFLLNTYRSAYCRSVVYIQSSDTSKFGEITVINITGMILKCKYGAILFRVMKSITSLHSYESCGTRKAWNKCRISGFIAFFVKERFLEQG